MHRTQRTSARPGERPRDDPDTGEAYAAVTSALWNERETLELVLFKLIQERLILASGPTRWLHKADAELAEALHRMRTGAVLRAAEVEAFAVRLDLPLETTLAELAELATEPWSMVLRDHRTALRALVIDIEAATTEVRSLLTADTADSRRVESAQAAQVAIANANYRAALQTTASIGQLSLLKFLD